MIIQDCRSDHPRKRYTSALITLDVTEEVIDEAISHKCDVLISHHPLIFNGIKSLTGKSFTERILYKAVKHDIAIYSAHTNLDVFSNGVSRKMAEKLGLEEDKGIITIREQVIETCYLYSGISSRESEKCTF